MIKLENVYKVYENGVVAIRDISMSLPQKGFVAIVGESGCGKSTLINILSNNDELSKGNISYHDEDYKSIDRRVLTKDFAYIYQDFKLIENMTVYQNIMLGHELANADINHDRVLEISKTLKIEQLLDEKVLALSGGQMQRVAIARALVRNPKVVFADEPTGNLDSKNSDNVYKILREISVDCLVVMVTHNSDAFKWVDRIIKLNDGKIVKDSLNEPDFAYINNFDDNIQEDEIVNNIVGKDKQTIGNKKNLKAFSYKKGANKSRAKSDLSNKSIVALAIAFGNKGLLKRIVLAIVAILMVAFIMMSTSMIFSNYEQTFVNNMKKNDVKYIQYHTRNIDYESAEANVNKLNNYIKETYGAKVYAHGGKSINYNFYQFVPSLDVGYVPQCYDDKLLARTQSLFIDDPSQLGIDIILGNAPSKEKEIAISLTYYNYLLKVGKFERDIAFVDGTQEVETVEFHSQEDIIGKYIKEFNLTITGVFEDNYRYSDWRNVPNNTVVDFNKEVIQNSLITAIILPQSESKNGQYFDNQWADYKLAYKHDGNYIDKYIGYMPLNNVTRDFYHTADILKRDLAPGEIIIADRWYLEKLEETIGRQINIGDKIDLSLVLTEKKISSDMKVIEEFQTKTFTIVDLPEESSNLPFDCVVMNEQDYFDWMKFKWVNTIFYISSEYITVDFMRDINRYYHDEILANTIHNPELDYTLSFDMNNFARLSDYDLDFINVMNKYIGAPLLIISSVVLAIIISIMLSDMIKSKGKDILILKSLGATNGCVAKIFSILTIIFAIMQFALGLLMGYAFLSGINYFTTLIGNYEIYFSTFWIGGANIGLGILAIFLVNVVALFYNITKLKGKNLRKAFQQQKK